MAVPATVAAVDVHEPLTVPAIERGAAIVAVRVNPLAAVRRCVGEFGIRRVVVDLRLRVRYEAALLVLLRERSAGEPPILVGGIVGFEVDELHPVAGAARHCVDDLLVDVLLAAASVQRLLRRARTVDRDDMDNPPADLLDQLAENRPHHHAEILGAERFLRHILRSLFTVLARSITEAIGQRVDLAIAHYSVFCRCGHGLGSHGVILLKLITCR